MFFSYRFFGILLFILCKGFAQEFCDRGSSAPYISGDSFRAIADHIFDETTVSFNPKKVKSGDVIFVKTDWEYLQTFFYQYHPEIDAPYVLVTHNSDHSAPGPFADFLNDPKLIRWFAQNTEGEPHPKLHSIPIGLANKCWEHGNPKTFSAHLPLAKNKDRSILCYLNFQPSTSIQERTYVKNLFAKKFWCYNSRSKPMPQYLNDLSCSQFVLSPRGNGLDCHGTWEALLMGAIPIVRTSSIDPLFNDLPVLIVDNWTIVNELFLHTQYEIMKNKKYNLDKLFVKYWIEQIRAESRL